MANKIDIKLMQIDFKSRNYKTELLGCSFKSAKKN